MCSFMVAPILKRASEKSLSSKVLINKEDFGIVGLILGWIKFDFWIVGWDFLLIFMGFYDMGCDNGFGEGRIGILVDFVGIVEDIDKVKFWRKSVDESAIGSAAFPGCLFSFCYPLYHIYTVFLHFTVSLTNIL